MIGAIIGDERSSHGNGLGAVNREARAWAEEVGLAQPVRLDVATVLVAQALEAEPMVDTACLKCSKHEFGKLPDSNFKIMHSQTQTYRSGTHNSICAWLPSEFAAEVEGCHRVTGR